MMLESIAMNDSAFDTRPPTEAEMSEWNDPLIVESIVEPIVGGKNKKERVRYRGRSYAVRVGPRGGRYVVVDGKKVYPVLH